LLDYVVFFVVAFSFIFFFVDFFLALQFFVIGSFFP
jgi:hypothetical protein